MKRKQFLYQSSLWIGGMFLFRNAFSTNENTDKMNKTVSQTSDLQFTQDFPGLSGVNIMARSYPIEPFLVFTEYRMTQPVFGPHPHAGVSVMTYMLPDSQQGFINRDSQGDFSVIEPGGMHVMQAGSGMHHDEFPQVAGVETHGFQIWINHADKDRWVAPASLHASAAQVPEVHTAAYRVRIVHGEFGGQTPAYKMVTPVTLLHIFLAPQQTITLDAKEMAFVYGLKGGGTTENASIHPQTLVNYSLQGNQVTVQAGANGLEFMFATGTPHNEGITYGGPFVMTTPEQMAEAKRRYANGDMGRLAPYKG
jgi:quercetin 2,3-dioxygenase